MRKQLQILILFLAISNVAIAQDDFTSQSTTEEGRISRVGLQVGMNSASMVFTKVSDPNIYPDLQFLPRLNAGIYSETGTTENFVFHIGLFYSGSGYKTESETVTLDYVQVPLVFNFRTDLFNDAYLQIGGGFYGAYAFSGKSTTDSQINRDIISTREADDADDVNDFYVLDLGLLLKADFEYNINDKRIVKIGASYNFGVLNTSNEVTENMGGGNFVTYDLGAKTRTLGINLTYLINLAD
ncbi:outer membrane beta-barrel protein [Marivirga tractuosa]|uniref:outer membrane beta-barrel protein n=1 Tax=Marivirga tractuosa TaxID=1006 RepID=UPI0035D131FA